MAVAPSFLRGPAMATFRQRHGFLKCPFFNVSRSCFASFNVSSGLASSTPDLSHLELEQTEVVVHGKELAIVQPRDVDKILDMYIKQGKLDGDPYWCRLWPSALVLAEEMLKNPQLVANLRVCDLGSGLGLAGVSALLAGAKEVVFYDQEPLALFCSLLTVHTNLPQSTTNLPHFVHQILGDSAVEYIQSLAYGFALSPNIFELPSTSQGAALTARAEVFDWSKKGSNTLSFDMVLACDVLYEKTSASQIAAVLPNLVRSGSGKVIMSDPTNRTPQHREEFLSLIGSNSSGQGLKVERIEKVQLKSNSKMEDVELMQFCVKDVW